MTDMKTEGIQPTSPGEDMSDRELLIYTARQVEELCDMVTARCDALAGQVGHLDEFAHAIDQKVTAITATLDQYRPLLEAAQRKADALGKVSAFMHPHPKGK